MTQKEKVKRILIQEKQIDNLFAIEKRISLRLGAIIHELRKEGFEITTTMVGSNCVYKLISVPTRIVMRPVFQEDNTVRMVESQEPLWTKN